jgi:phenylacetate-CoA ligase
LAGVKPEDIKSVEDLKEVPMTTKAEIQASPLNDVVANNIDVTKCVKGITSGSTGLPLTIIIDRKGDDFRLALWGRAYFENGLRTRDKMATIIDPRHIRKRKRWVERLGILRRKEISVFDDVSHQMDILESFKPDVLKGYSSSLMILADFCKKKKGSARPRFIYTGAELLLEKDRKLIGSAFGCDVLDYYGASEFSLLAWECQNHIGYHMNSDATVIEFVNNGEVVAPGERGEVVCTSLVNTAMPLIRYRIGDIGIPLAESCSCGRSLPLLKMLEGRTDDFLISLDGRIIPPTIFFPYPFKSLKGIKQFKVIQEKRDKMTIQLAVEQELQESERFLEQARREIERVFGKGMRVDFQFLEKIDKDPTGKLRKIVSRIPVTWR